MAAGGGRFPVEALMRTADRLALALIGLVTACVPSPDQIRSSPENTWTWQVNRNYRRFAHCLTDQLNGAPEHSWFFQAPRPITTFDEQWQRNQITLKSVDPWGVEQVLIQVISVSNQGSRVVARVKDLQRLGGGAPMYYVRAYVDVCAAA